MSETAYPRLDVTPHWADLNQHLIETIDVIPEEKLDWSPDPGEWNFRGIYLHIAGARLHWLANAVHDGEPLPDIVRQGQTAEGLKAVLRDSWERTLHFLSDERKLDASYSPPPFDPGYLDPETFDGHFIAYHRLLHDVHHRATILHYLNLLGIELPEDRRRRPL